MPTQYTAYPQQVQVASAAIADTATSWNNLGAMTGSPDGGAGCPGSPDTGCAWVRLRNRRESETVDLWDFPEFDDIPDPDTTPLTALTVRPITRACPIGLDNGKIITHVLGVKKPNFNTWAYDGDDYCNCRWGNTLQCWHVGDGIPDVQNGQNCQGMGSSTWGLSLTVGDIKQMDFRIRFACESCNLPYEYRADVDAIEVIATI